MHHFLAEVKHLLFCLCAQNAFMDLVDVFAMPSEPPSDRPWNASHPGDTDPWDSLGEPFQAAFIDMRYVLHWWLGIIVIAAKTIPQCTRILKMWKSDCLLTHLSITKEDSSTTRRADPPWITQPASSSPPPPWEPPADSWDGPQRNVSNLSAIGQDWALPGTKSERTGPHTAQQSFHLTH